MSSHEKLNYLKGIIICHGKSEVCMARYITTNLHLNIEQFSNHNGKYSIQITSLLNFLNAPPFDKKTSFEKEYEVESSGKGKNKIYKNFKLFIIMDTDDCTQEQKEDFINKEMFKKHWLKDYIVPIYNSESLEDVLLECGIMAKRIGEKEKGTYYQKIFPINRQPLSFDTVKEIKDFKDKISKSKHTNMSVVIDYCLDNAQKL